MKSLITVILVLLISYSAYAITVPDAVLDAFAKKFPAAEKVTWEQDEDNSNEYEASFVLNSIDCSASFTGTGEWLETETQIGFEFLPKIIQDAYYSDFKDVKLIDVNLIQSSDMSRKYEIEYEKKGEQLDVEYDETGNQIKDDDSN